MPGDMFVTHRPTSQPTAPAGKVDPDEVVQDPGCRFDRPIRAGDSLRERPSGHASPDCDITASWSGGNRRNPARVHVFHMRFGLALVRSKASGKDERVTDLGRDAANLNAGERPMQSNEREGARGECGMRPDDLRARQPTSEGIAGGRPRFGSVRQTGSRLPPRMTGGRPARAWSAV